MKYKKVDHWTKLDDQEGLLFFAQILDEALFDYTLESYKPQALNLRLLCIEALQTIDNIKLGLLKKPNINSIIDELKWSLNNDRCAQEILGNNIVGILERIEKNCNNIHALKNDILFLYHYFDSRKYLIKLQEILIKIIPENKEKEKIYFLSKSLLTELINYGYSPGYIYFSTNNFFFNRANPFDKITPEAFFAIFNFEPKEYTIIFKASKLFEEFKDISETLGIKIQKKIDIPLILDAEKIFLDNVGHDQTLIIFEKIEGLDDNFARIVAEYSLNRIADLFSFYHHKESPKIENVALVLNNIDNTYLLRERPIKSIIKRADVSPTVAVSKVGKLIGGLALNKNSAQMLSRAIALHSNALETNPIENKLLSLWTAIETLIPKDSESGTDRIIQIVNALTPFQTVGYIRRIVEQAGSDFWHYNKWEASRIIGTTPDKYYPLCEFIATKENKLKRDEVYKKITTSPLLRWRLFYLNKKFSNGKSIKKLILDHRQKVEWQIRRIYRVRNLIVHSGKNPSFTNILVENLHNYFDSFLNYIIDNTIDDSRIRTIDEAIINCQIEYDNLLRSLNDIGDKDIDVGNYKNFF